MTSTVLLADDHSVYRKGMRQLVDAQPGFHVIAEASSGAQARALIAENPPDIALLDISMPESNGLELLAHLQKERLRTSCILVTMYDLPAYAAKAFESGARGYVLKSDDDSVLINCLQRVAAGQKFVSPALEAQLSESQGVANAEIVELNALQLAELSDREREIMLLISHNNTSREIAERLSVSVRTVQNHRSNICKKLGLRGANALLKLSINNQDMLQL